VLKYDYIATFFHHLRILAEVMQLNTKLVFDTGKNSHLLSNERVSARVSYNSWQLTLVSVGPTTTPLISTCYQSPEIYL
jgi:hypothetical protein